MSSKVMALIFSEARMASWNGYYSGIINFLCSVQNPVRASHGGFPQASAEFPKGKHGRIIGLCRTLSASVGSSLLGILADKITHMSQRLMLTALRSARERGDPFSTEILGRFCNIFHSLKSN